MSREMDWAKITKAAGAGVRVKAPRFGSRCWAWVKQRSNGSMSARLYGHYANCQRDARSGCLTCTQHADREDEAQQEKGRTRT